MSFENKGVIPATAIVSQDPDRSGNFVADGTDGGATLQAAIDYVFGLYGGGRIVIQGPLLIDDQDIVIPALTSDLIIQGHGHRKGAGTLNQARESKSYLEFQGGYHITNALVAECNGHFMLRDIGIIFNGLINDYGMDMEYIPFGFDRCMFNDFNCTFTNWLDALVCQSAVIPPEAGMSWFRDCDFSLNAANAVGIYVSKEALGVYNTHVSLNGADQVFWEVLHPGLPNSGFNIVDHLEIWLDAGAEGTKIFEFYNSEKTVAVGSILAAANAGAGSTAFNVIFGLRPGQTWNTITPSVISKAVDGIYAWGIPPGAVGNYLWESADAQERVSFVKGSQFKGVLIEPPQKSFIDQTTALNIAPAGASPGTVFHLNKEREVDLRLVTQARVTVRAQGNEAGNLKGVNIYDVSTGAILCDTGTWAGAAVTYITGPWTNVTANALRNCNAYGYSDSATENMDCWVSELETR